MICPYCSKEHPGIRRTCVTCWLWGKEDGGVMDDIEDPLPSQFDSHFEYDTGKAARNAHPSYKGETR